MSPLSVRRFRAERLLREEFQALRGRVLATVQARLHAGGVRLDRSDVEASYAIAWQALYAAVLEGQEIANPGGWLVLVTYRRAIEEQRARQRADGAGRSPRASDPFAAAELGAAGVVEVDIAGTLDDRAMLRDLLEGLRGRLDEREREAATLCYLHGLSRAEAARRMGLSERRMRKLMEGRSPGRPGVAGKVGALVATIRAGAWCDEQGSLMRAFAYGLLEPAGERYRLAAAHAGSCPACRAYVRSLRGLAVAIPPVLAPWGVGAGALAGAASGTLGAGAAGGAAGASGAASAGTAGGVAGGTAGGAAGGGWLLAGGAGAKLAAGCLLALGIGAGCVELGVVGGRREPGPGHAPLVRSRPSAPVGAVERAAGADARPKRAGVAEHSLARRRRAAAGAASAPGSAVEFGPERPGVAGARTQRASPPAPAAAGAALSAPAAAAPAGAAAAVSPGEREFSPG